MEWQPAGFDSILSFENLPLWRGVQSRPGIRELYPFRLGFLDRGPIRQVTGADVIQRVVSAYESEDYGFMTVPPGASIWANSLGDMYVDFILDACRGRKPRRILEVGAGSLYVATRLMEQFDATEYVVVDPSIHETAPAGPIKVVSDYFPCGNLEGRAYDLAIALNCLEHVPDPVAFCGELRDHMAENGIAILVFPNCEAALAHGDLNVLVHEHLTYFTPASVRWLAAASGLRIRAVQSVHDTFLVVLQKEGKRTAGGDDCGEDIAHEPDLLQLAATSFRQVLESTGSLVKEAVSEGRKVAFHGATNGLNTFLYLLGTEIAGQCQVFDGDTSKTGLYLPACDKPILPSDHESYAEFDLTIVSAMSYFDQIRRFVMTHHRMDGGRLIPLAV